jgi:hypothetical protein
MSSTDDKLVRLPLDARTHSRFRMIAAARGKPMSQVARAIVEDFVEARSVEGDPGKVASPSRRPRK